MKNEKKYYLLLYYIINFARNMQNINKLKLMTSVYYRTFRLIITPFQFDE